MRVLMMVTWFSSKDAATLQAGVFHYEQSMDLIKHGVEMALYYPFDETIDEDFSREIERDLLTYRSKRKGGQLARNAGRIFSALKKIKKDFNPNVIHAHVAPGAGIYAIVFGKMLGTPVMLTEHNPVALAGYDNVLIRNIAKFVYKHSKYNACVSLNSKKELEEMFPSCRFGLVYNGVIAPECQEKNEVYAVSGKINISIVATFYSEWIKGYQFLLPAIKQLMEEGYSDVMLHIVGGGTYEAKYIQMAEDLEISDHCIFYGNCDKQKVYDIMNQMDFGLSTSLVECSGVSVQEMLMLGKPMVITKSGGANSLVNQNTAIVVEKESSQAIVDGIKAMIAHRDEYKASEIKQYAYSNFEIGEISKKYMEIYHSILENDKR